MRVLRGGVLLAVLLTVGACAPTGRPRAPEPPTTVRVENGNFQEMTIYVMRSTQRVRLGTVPGLSTRVLRIPPGIVSGIASVRFLADPLGSRAVPVSHEIPVSPGDEVELHIMP